MNASAALRGRRIINTRPAAQAAALSQALGEHGAVAVEIPVIEVVEHPAELDRLAAYGEHLERFDWLVVTSPNGAAAVRRAVGEPAWDHPGRPALAAVGRATAATLDRAVALIPRHSNGAGLVAEFPRGSGRVLVVQSAGAAGTVVDGIRGLGWDVAVVATHQAVAVTPTAAQRRAAVGADALILASGSAARAWADSMAAVTPPIVVAIGPQCAAVAAQRDLRVSAVAGRYDIDGVVATLADVFDESTA